jgi:selenocysteine-specific elongation factor
MHQPSYVIGTAGHVDHGKSTLVKALTGIDPDRLREEKEREMTIDLGFAWLELPNGSRVSIIDVPGHERFIKNMLAGIGGLDAALLVVAADEGPMPQTREHLAILDLLEIKSGVVALTKRDLVDDDWFSLVAEETREMLDGTALAGASMIPVSAISGARMTELVDALTTVLGKLPPRDLARRARLSIDRVFSVAGFGTVVTGTLLGSSLAVGEEVEILPQGLRGRIRGLQVHGEPTGRAGAGSRVAVNLAGVERDALRRGDVLAAPGWLEPTRLIDVQLRLTSDAGRMLRQNDEVDFFVGALESPVKLTLLDTESLAPGETGWVQLRFEQPVVAAPGDLFIIRQPSPSLTIGGGRVVDVHPRRHRRFRAEVLKELETRAAGSPIDQVVLLVGDTPKTGREIAAALGYSVEQVVELLGSGIKDGRLVALQEPSGGGPLPAHYVLERTRYAKWQKTINDLLATYHQKNSLRRGMPREEVRRRIQWEARPFDAFVTKLGRDLDIQTGEAWLALPGHTIRLTPAQQEKANRFLAGLAANPNAPPSPGEFAIDPDLLSAMVELGSVIRITDDIVFGSAHVDKVANETLAFIDRHGSITLGQFRDHFGSSRKYAQALLEYFDQRQVTKRVGEARVRGRG